VKSWYPNTKYLFTGVKWDEPKVSYSFHVLVSSLAYCPSGWSEKKSYDPYFIRLYESFCNRYSQVNNNNVRELKLICAPYIVPWVVLRILRAHLAIRWTFEYTTVSLKLIERDSRNHNNGTSFMHMAFIFHTWWDLLFQPIDWFQRKGEWKTWESTLVEDRSSHKPWFFDLGPRQ